MGTMATGIGKWIDDMIGIVSGFFGRRVVQLALIVLVVLALVITVRSCTGNRQKAEQGKQDSRNAAATAETAKDAAKTVIDQAREEASIDDLVDQTQKEIDDAKDEKDSRRAAVRAICGLPEYRDHAACKLQ